MRSIIERFNGDFSDGRDAMVATLTETSGVAFGDGTFVAVGENGMRRRTSPCEKMYATQSDCCSIAIHPFPVGGAALERERHFISDLPGHGPRRREDLSSDA